MSHPAVTQKCGCDGLPYALMTVPTPSGVNAAQVYRIDLACSNTQLSLELESLPGGTTWQQGALGDTFPVTIASGDTRQCYAKMTVGGTTPGLVVVTVYYVVDGAEAGILVQVKNLVVWHSNRDTCTVLVDYDKTADPYITFEAWPCLKPRYAPVDFGGCCPGLDFIFVVEFGAMSGHVLPVGDQYCDVVSDELAKYEGTVLADTFEAPCTRTGFRSLHEPDEYYQGGIAVRVVVVSAGPTSYTIQVTASHTDTSDEGFNAECSHINTSSATFTDMSLCNWLQSGQPRAVPISGTSPVDDDAPSPDIVVTPIAFGEIGEPVGPDPDIECVFEPDIPCEGTSLHLLSVTAFGSNYSFFEWSTISEDCSGKCVRKAACIGRPPFALPKTIVRNDSEEYTTLIALVGEEIPGECGCPTGGSCNDTGSGSVVLVRTFCPSVGVGGSYLYYFTTLAGCPSGCGDDGTCEVELPFTITGYYEEPNEEFEELRAITTGIPVGCACSETPYTPPECPPACESCDDVDGPLIVGVLGHTFTMTKTGDCTFSGPSSLADGSYAEIEFLGGTWSLQIHLATEYEGEFDSAGYEATGSNACANPISMTFQDGSPTYEWPDPVSVTGGG